MRESKSCFKPPVLGLGFGIPRKLTTVRQAQMRDVTAILVPRLRSASLNALPEGLSFSSVPLSPSHPRWASLLFSPRSPSHSHSSRRPHHTMPVSPWQHKLSPPLDSPRQQIPLLWAVISVVSEERKSDIMLVKRW